MRIGSNWIGILAIVICFVIAVAMPRYWWIGAGLGVVFTGWLIYQYEYK